MALMQCPECNHSVSTQAASCPGCGHPINDTRTGAMDNNVAGKLAGALAAWLVAPWVARAIFAVVGAIALFTFLSTR
ncbi:MAG: zinc ribbon domain-containing protein [Proteobacteria bacterium]|nr:MAG: zinc ribbon domain-containing protein [Pseudomonadota bacterium]